MPDDSKLISYNPDTRQLDTVPDAFDGRGLSVLSIVYSAGIDHGASVSSGDEFAKVQWEDNSREALLIPANCSGRIEDVNRNIVYENLPFSPAQRLLIIAAE